MKIRPVGAELFHERRQTDRHDEAESLFAILRMRTKTVTVFCYEETTDQMQGCVSQNPSTQSTTWLLVRTHNDSW